MKGIYFLGIAIFLIILFVIIAGIFDIGVSVKKHSPESLVSDEAFTIISGVKDYISIPFNKGDELDFREKAEITTLFWMKLEKIPPSNELGIRPLYLEGYTSSDGKEKIAWFVKDNKDGTYDIFWRISSYESYSETACNNIPYNEWRMFTGTYGDGYNKIYLNEKLCQSIEQTGNIKLIGVAGDEWMISDASQDNKRRIVGVIDEVKIWNSVLNESKIFSEYSSITGNLDKPLTINNCVDSDGGVNYYLKGTVEILETTKTKSVTDECAVIEGDDYNDVHSCGGSVCKLVEYSCSIDGEEIIKEFHDCEIDCEDGACSTEEERLKKWRHLDVFDEKLVAHYNFNGGRLSDYGGSFNHWGEFYGIPYLTEGIFEEAYKFGEQLSKSIIQITIKNYFIFTKKEKTKYILCPQGSNINYSYGLDYDIYVDGAYFGEGGSYKESPDIKIKLGKTKVIEIKAKIPPGYNHRNIYELILFKLDEDHGKINCEKLIEESYNEGVAIKII